MLSDDSHILALLDCDPANIWHWLHAQLLHRLPTLLLRATLLSPGASTLCSNVADLKSDSTCLS